MVVEGVLSGLVFLLAIAATAAMILGIGGLLGAVRLVRCAQCGRMDMVARRRASEACVYCRHTRLFHPVSALHHPHEHQHAT